MRLLVLANSNDLENNAIKLASFSALLLAGICIFPQEEIPATKTNEATITVSDEVFKVQSNNLPVLAEEVSFEGAEEKESASGIIEFLEETFGLTLSN
jgi:hypothetical protein